MVERRSAPAGALGGHGDAGRGEGRLCDVALLAFVAVSERRGLRPFTAMGRAELAVAACTAIASGSFIVALNHTTVANVLFMQAVAPIAAALIAWVALRERSRGAPPSRW